MVKCGCCGQQGRTRSGCSCTGGKSHVCLRLGMQPAISSASSSLAPPTSSLASESGHGPSEACDQLLEYVLTMQRIYHEKRQGHNWFTMGFGDVATQKHAPPHREEGYINTLILDLVSQLVTDGKLSVDADIVGFAAIGIAFKHEKLIKNLAEYISECGVGDILSQLPMLIAESEVDGVVPLVPFWQRAKAHISAMKAQSKASLEHLDGDPEMFPKLSKDVETRYIKEIGFVRRVIGTEFGQTAQEYIKSLGNTLDSGNIAELVVYLVDGGLLKFTGWSDINDTLATPFSGFWRGLGQVYNMPVSELTHDHVKKIRDEALTRTEWLTQFKAVGGSPDKLVRAQFFVHNLCEMQKKQRWVPRSELHRQWLEDYKNQAANSDIQPKRIMKGPVHMTKSAWKSLIPGIHVDSDIEGANDTNENDQNDGDEFEVELYGCGISVTHTNTMTVRGNDNAGDVVGRAVAALTKIQPYLDVSMISLWINCGSPKERLVEDGELMSDIKHEFVWPGKNLKLVSKEYDSISSAVIELKNACKYHDDDFVRKVQSYVKAKLDECLDDSDDDEQNDGQYDWKALLKNTDCEAKTRKDIEQDAMASSSSLQSSSEQIFLKTLSGQSISLDVMLNDTIDNVKTKFQNQIDYLLRGYDVEDVLLKEKELWNSGRYGLSFAGKLLENDCTIESYGILKGDTLTMVYGLNGGGKRARGKAGNENTKTSTVDDIEHDINKLIRELGDIAGDGTLQQAFNEVRVAIEGCRQDVNMIKNLMEQMDKPTLEKLLAALESTNGDGKVSNIKALIFRQSGLNIRSLNDKSKTLSDLLWATTNYMITQGYVSECGTVQWATMKQDIMAQISNRDQVIGAQLAMANRG